jgi:glutaredoxin 3
MAKVIVYTMNYCPYCIRAKQLLNQKGVPFEERLVADDDDIEWDRLEKLSGMKTMPQIFHGDQLIGGYNDLAVLDQKQGLSHLKA